MKKHTLIKLIVLSLTVIVGASVLTGCTFSYDEETDMGQVILEINPVTLTYEVPVYEDYTDPTGKVVIASYDYDRTSETFGTKRDAAVRSVRRTANGDPVRVAQTDNGRVKYVGYENIGSPDVGKEIEGGVFADDSRVLKDRVSAEHFVSPAVENSDGSVSGGIEYKYLGKVTSGDASAARWERISDGAEFLGSMIRTNTSNTNVTGSYATAANYLAELPAINYDFSTDKYFWEKLTPVYKTAEYVSEKEEFFKHTMDNYFSNYAINMIQEEGRTVEEVFDEFVKNFYVSYLTGVEIDLAILSGEVEWGLTEVNTVNRAIYDGIDTALDGIYSEISDDFNQTYPGSSDAAESDSTYPTPDEEEVEDPYDKDYEFWHITNYPERLIGNDTNDSRVSLEREAMRRFVRVVANNIEDEYALSDTDRAKYNADIAAMNAVLRESDKTKIDELYTNLWTYDVIYYMYGESQAYSLKTSAYREHLGDGISTDGEYKTAYESRLADQITSFNSNIENYYTAATGNETILYFADNEIFWVKHILIPFTADETERLNAFVGSDAAKNAFRQQLGENVTVFKHVDGEDDTSKAYTINEAYAEINAKMRRAYSDDYSCERAFEELIYTYNTDPGIFPGTGSALGYAVRATAQADGGASETYMIEFANEARALLNAYRNNQTLKEFKDSSNADVYASTKYDDKYMNTEVEIGSISAPVLTDYGWHIMYLSAVPTAGKIMAYNAWQTPGRYSKIYEAVGGGTFDTQLSNAYNSWQESVADKYAAMDGIIVPHKERFQGKLDEYEQYYGAEEEEEEGSTTTS